mmetsp:Transcript_21676/g.30323  ORF Transcript_21676/g.30323 Transcript_21676/m.30323 type:complete len:203 (-) Transcript_21676:21-629(-)
MQNLSQIGKNPNDYLFAFLETCIDCKFKDCWLTAIHAVYELVCRNHQHTTSFLQLVRDFQRQAILSPLRENSNVDQARKLAKYIFAIPLDDFPILFVDIQQHLKQEIEIMLNQSTENYLAKYPLEPFLFRFKQLLQKLKQGKGKKVQSPSQIGKKRPSEIVDFGTTEAFTLHKIRTKHNWESTEEIQSPEPTECFVLIEKVK